MSAKKLLTRFARDECGAVSVDWVVLAAACVGLGIGVVSTVQSGSNDFANYVNGSLEDKILP